MLDRNPALAVPDESYFVPQLARRHRGVVDAEAFTDDLRRLPTLAEWGLPPDSVAARLRPGMTTGEAIAAVFEAYAAARGKPRWGDKTPLYMQYLPLLEALFPTALYVHLVRDGRDAALSYLAVPEGIMTAGWGHPRDAAGFACQWATEIRAAQDLGRRVGRPLPRGALRGARRGSGEGAPARVRLRRARVRRRDARLRRRDRVGAQGAPAAAQRAAAGRRPRLAHGDAAGPTARRSRRSRATSCTSSATRSPRAATPGRGSPPTGRRRPRGARSAPRRSARRSGDGATPCCSDPVSEPASADAPPTARSCRGRRRGCRSG